MNADGVDRLIAKLILNSLYGRFGLYPDNVSTAVLSDKELEKLLRAHEILSALPISRGVNLVNYRTDPSEEICRLSGEDYLEHLFNNNVDYVPFKAVNIAAAITAYGRIIMNDFKNEKLYYTDTDSIFIDEVEVKRLGNIGNGIGQWKVEYKIEEAWFIAPKIYLLSLGSGSYIKKFRGLSPELVNVEDYMQLFRGEPVHTGMRKWFKGTMSVSTIDTALTIDPFYWKTKREKIIYMPSGEVWFAPLKIEEVALTPQAGKQSDWLIKRTRRRLLNPSLKKVKPVSKPHVQLLLEPLNPCVSGPSQEGPEDPDAPSPDAATQIEHNVQSPGAHTQQVRGSKEPPEPCPYRLSARKFFLRFDISNDGEITQPLKLFSRLRRRFGEHVKYAFISCVEKPEDRAAHIYILLALNKKLNTRDKHYFDFVCESQGTYGTVRTNEVNRLINGLSRIEGTHYFVLDSSGKIQSQVFGPQTDPLIQ
jgi:hypothetical protein